MKNNINILATVVISLFLLASCEDLPPNVYDPKPYVEAYLIVDQPIKNVRIMWTQSLTDTFNYEKSFIRDAEVLLHYNDKTIKLVSPRSGTDGYYYPDTNLKVLPQTEYKLDILLKDGSNITATTYTPGRFNWTIPPPPELYYPQDTINLSDAPDTLKLAWEKNPPGIYYFIRVQCLDTANYGIYLIPQPPIPTDVSTNLTTNRTIPIIPKRKFGEWFRSTKHLLYGHSSNGMANRKYPF